MRPPVSRAAFASVLMGPRALGASLVAARCAASSPAAAATAAVTAYDHASFVKEIAVTSPPEHLNSLLNVLQARGEKIVSPGAKRGLIPCVVPLSESPAGNLTSLLRWPTAPTGMEMPVVEVRKHGLWLLAKNVKQYIHRILVEADINADTGDDLWAAVGEAGNLYAKGDFKESQLPDLDVYLLKKVGLFPDVIERKTLRHLEKGDNVSALITGEFYSRDQFPGFGRPFVFNAEILKRVGRTSEAKDSARVALKSPWWTLGCSYEIRDLKVAQQEQDIGFYAGFVGASYFLARTCSSVPWGMFADKYGRKPCIMISILSVIAFNTLFGLSTTYWMAIVTRGLLGMLCGILGPIKAYAIEVCRKEHQALGISIVTTSDAIALVVGPAIGGFLSQPAEKYPNVFSKESIFGRFPYFLPSFVISILAMGSCIACIWLPETLHFHIDEKVEATDEVEAQVGDSTIQVGKAKQSSDRSTKNLLKNWQLMSAIILYCIFCLHDVAYAETFSLWAVSNRKFHGLGLTSQEVGTVLAVSGCGLLIYQLFVYPFIVKYLGPIRPLRPTVVLSILLLTTYPFMVNLQGLELKVLINIASLMKNVFYATINIACNILQNTAVTQEQRGVANGISMTLMSLFKGVAPAAAGILFSWAQKHMNGGLFLPGDQIMFLTINMVSILGLILTFKPFFSMSNALRRS